MDRWELYSSPDEASDDEVSEQGSIDEAIVEEESANSSQSQQSIASGQEFARRRGRKRKREPIVLPEIVVDWTTSNKGNRMAILDGEIYAFAFTDKVKVNHWRCIKQKDGCKMELETDKEDRCVLRSTGDHTHCTSKAEIEVGEFSRQIPELARHGHKSGRQIFSNLIENVSDKAKSRLVQHNISRRVYYYQQKQSKDPTTPRNPEDLEIPVDLLLYKGQPFVMHDTGKGRRRIILFSTPKLIEFLEGAEWWGLDGTFKLVPKGWCQLLSIHAKIGETFVPCLHALLPKKSMGTYSQFFSILKQLLPLAQVMHVHTDFERALLNAFSSAYPFANQHGCYFHFSQSLFRKVQKLGLVCRYKEGKEFAQVFDRLKSLVYVPALDVKEAFDEVIRISSRRQDGSFLFPDGSPESAFLAYFVKTWIGVTSREARPLFAVELWNCYQLTLEGKAKTTNSLEAWHNSLKYAMGTEDGKKLRFWRWLGKLKKECALQEAHLVAFQTGTPAKLKAEDKKICIQREKIALKYNAENIIKYITCHSLLVDMNS